MLWGPAQRSEGPACLPALYPFAAGPGGTSIRQPPVSPSSPRFSPRLASQMSLLGCQGETHVGVLTAEQSPPQAACLGAKNLNFFPFQASCHATSPRLPRGYTRHDWLAGMGVPGGAGLQHHPQSQEDGDRAVPGEPDPAVPLALGKLRQTQPGGAGVVGLAAWGGMAGMGGRGRGDGHGCCGCVEPHRPVSPLTGQDGWAVGRTGCPALPYQPLPQVSALRCRARAVAQAPSLRVLRHLAPSTFVRAPPLCTLHRLARSIISHAPSSRVLRLRTRFLVGHAPSLRTLLCRLRRCARSVFVDAASRVLHRHARSIVVHPPSPYPPVATEDNPELGSRWQGGLCMGVLCPSRGAQALSPQPLPPRLRHIPSEQGLTLGGGRCLRALVPVQK